MKVLKGRNPPSKHNNGSSQEINKNNYQISMKIQDGLNSEPVENVIKPGLWNHQQNLES